MNIHVLEGQRRRVYKHHRSDRPRHIWLGSGLRLRVFRLACGTREAHGRSSLDLAQWPIRAMRLPVNTACIAQHVARFTTSPPEWRRTRRAIGARLRATVSALIRCMWRLAPCRLGHVGTIRKYPCRPPGVARFCFLHRPEPFHGTIDVHGNGCRQLGDEIPAHLLLVVGGWVSKASRLAKVRRVL